MHVLFGTVLALNTDALTLIGLVTSITLVTMQVFRRALIAECLDPLFLRSVSKLGSPVHFIFLGLVVLNLVAGFQALGTLLSVGLMVLPATAARFWTSRVETMSWSPSPLVSCPRSVGSCSPTISAYHPVRRSSCRLE